MDAAVYGNVAPTHQRPVRHLFEMHPVILRSVCFLVVTAGSITNDLDENGVLWVAPIRKQVHEVSLVVVDIAFHPRRKFCAKDCPHCGRLAKQIEVI